MGRRFGWGTVSFAARLNCVLVAHILRRWKRIGGVGRGAMYQGGERCEEAGLLVDPGARVWHRMFAPPAMCQRARVWFHEDQDTIFLLADLAEIDGYQEADA